MKKHIDILLKSVQHRNLLLLSSMLLIVFITTSCEDTFETDITDDTVELLTPQEGYAFLDPNVSYWWNPVSGATAYNLKVIKIDTSQNNALVELLLDSNVTETQYQMSMDPGSYEWGVIAYNGAYETDYFYGFFHVDSTLDISNVSLILSTPSGGLASKETSFTFTWESLYSADYYTWELRSPDENGNLIKTVSDITSATLTTDIDDEGTYSWGVYAFNNSSSTSSKKTWRTITIDRTNPSAPDLLLPTQIDTVYTADLISDKIKFSWDAPTDNGSALSYQLYISSDSLFTDLAELANVSVSDTTYLWTPNSSHSKFYWRMKTVDAAGNESGYSLERRFWHYDQ